MSQRRSPRRTNCRIAIASGTSFASPYAAGIAALTLSVNDALTAAEVEGVMQAGSVDLGAGTTEFAVYYEGHIQHAGVFPFGGSTVTSDLVKGLSVPFAEAQKAKEQFGAAFAQLVDPQETVELPGPAPGARRRPRPPGNRCPFARRTRAVRRPRASPR